MRKLILWLLIFSVGAPLAAQTRPGPFDSETYPLRYDGRRPFEPETRPVREIETIKGTPLFKNLPFLRLRAGDELIKSQITRPGFKGQNPTVSEAYLLKRGGQYQEVAVKEVGGERTLWDWSDLRSFSWELTRANAEKLWNWKLEPAERLTIEQLRRVETALLPDFAEHLGEEWQMFTEFEEWADTVRVGGKAQPKPVPQPGFIAESTGTQEWPGPSFTFAGLGFDGSATTFYAFQMRFGEAGAAFYKKPILVGPKSVDSAYFRQGRGPNGPAISPAKGARLLRFQAQRARHEKFLEIVMKALNERP